AVIRSVVGATGRHDAYQCMTGWAEKDLANLGGRPSLGAVLARLHGPVDPSVPPFVGLSAPTKHLPWSDSGKPGFLGPSYNPFKPDGPGMTNLKLNGVTMNQLSDRRRLLASFDGLRREIDSSGTLSAIDANVERALGVLTSSKLLDALDLSKEP